MMRILRRQKMGFRLGPLSILAMLLLVSSLLRFLGGPASAIAKEVADIGMGEAVGNTLGACAPTPDVAALLAALADRETRIEQREAYVAERSAILSEAESEIERQLAALLAAEEKLAATMSVASTAAEDDIARLTAVYENMKPKEAALLFETMSPTFAAGFLGRMRPDSAAKVVEGLTPEVAYSISVILAGRNADVPTR